MEDKDWEKCYLSVIIVGKNLLSSSSKGEPFSHKAESNKNLLKWKNQLLVIINTNNLLRIKTKSEDFNGPKL